MILTVNSDELSVLWNGEAVCVFAVGQVAFRLTEQTQRCGQRQAEWLVHIVTTVAYMVNH